MAGDTPTKSSEHHLARVRDNQRRSRARRKQYIQELEDKFRRCEQYGAEASAEMQAAALRVLEENNRLRRVLRVKGISDREIDADANANLPQRAESIDLPLQDILLSNRQCPSPSQQLSFHLSTKRACGSPDCSFKGDASTCSSATNVPCPQDVKPSPFSHTTSSFETCMNGFGEPRLSLPASQGSYDARPMWQSREDTNHDASIDFADAGHSSINSSNVGSHMGSSSAFWPISHQQRSTYISQSATDSSLTSQGIRDADGIFGVTADPLKILLSPARKRNFLRYLGMDGQNDGDGLFDPAHLLQVQNTQPSLRPMSRATFDPSRASHDPSIVQSGAQMHTAYCYHSKAWKRIDDPCWITCSMIAAEAQR